MTDKLPANKGKCSKCKGIFDKEILIHVNSNYFCPECNKNRESYLFFAEHIRKIYGIITSKEATKINTQRRKLLDRGYSDEEIINAVYFYIKEKNYDKKNVTIGFVNKTLIEEMRKAREQIEYKENRLLNVFSSMEYRKLYPPKRKNRYETKKNINDNISDLLGDDVF